MQNIKGKHMIPFGAPPSLVEWKDEKNMEEHNKIVEKWKNLFPLISESEAFECVPRIFNTRCFICYKSLDFGPLLNSSYSTKCEEININPQFLGQAVYCYPTDITEEERERQSKLQIEINNRKTSDNVEIVGDCKDIKLYNPYPKCQKPSSSINPVKIEDKKRLKVKITSANLCVDCRNLGESGGIHPNTGGKIDTLLERNAINKWTQANYKIAEFRNKRNDGSIEKELITDRFTIYYGVGPFPENNILSQLALFQSMSGSHFDNLQSPKLEQEIAKSFRVLLPLLRSATELMMKDSEKPEIGDFEKSFTLYLRILRIILFFIDKYPLVKEILTRNVYKWNANPFAKENRELFDHFFDIIFLSNIVNIPFNMIKRNIMLITFEQVLKNFDTTMERMAKKDKVTFLRQLFNEGRTRKMIKQLLLILSFTQIIREYSTTSDMIKYMDAHAGTVTWDKYIKIWKDFQYCISSVISFEPILSDGIRMPGLWLHLGMEDSLEGYDDREIRNHIYLFFGYLLANRDKWYKSKLTEDIESRIEKIRIDHSQYGTKSVTIKETAEKLGKENNKRLENEYNKHKGFPVPNKYGQVSLYLCECLFPKCGREFISSNDLKKHLKECDRDYEDYFHVNHNARIKNLKLSKEEVLKGGERKCPYLYCDQSIIYSPEELCEHLALLGIRDFWYPQWKPKEKIATGGKQEEEEEDTNQKEREIKNSFENPGMCVSCMETPCNIILVPCGHVNLCEKCLELWGKHHKSTCPSCRKKIDQTFPLSMGIDAETNHNMRIYFAGLIEVH